MAKVEELLPELAELRGPDVQYLLGSLQDEIKIGLDRISLGKPPTQEDGGLLAIPYPVGRPSREELDKCPARRIVAAVFGGQNWRAEVWQWNGLVWQKEMRSSYTRSIEQEERVFKGNQAFRTYVMLMSEVIDGCLQQTKNPQEISSLAVSFGFRQKNDKVDYGIEAYLLEDNPAKYWSIEKAKGEYLGKPLLTTLGIRGFKINRVCFANDALAVALDTTAGANTLPLGIVLGSGGNVAIEKNGVLVNLEAGRAQSLGEDSILCRMREFDLTPEDETRFLLEYYFTGAFLLSRLVAALYLLAEKKVIDERIGERFLIGLREKGNNPQIIDWLIIGLTNREELSSYLDCELKEEEFDYIRQTAQLVMKKAVEVAALMIVAVLRFGDWQEGQIPVIGSVFWKARVTQDRKIFGNEVMCLVNQWTGGRFEAVEADELRGVASLALIHA